MEGKPRLLRSDGAVGCARCGTPIRVDNPQNRWCPACGVFLCVACAKADAHADRPGGRPKMSTNSLRALVLTCTLCTILAGLASAYMVALDQDDLSRANIPVTSIADLTVGGLAKVNGTIQGIRIPVLYVITLGDSISWEVSPFNVTDASGSVLVDMAALQGSDSYRTVQSGVHDGSWWTGDSVAVLGTVDAWPNGTLHLHAEYIARTPTSFARAGYAALVMIGLTGAGGLTAVTASSIRRARIRRHGASSGAYFPKVTADLLCRACGAPLDAGTGMCPRCGELTNLQPGVRPSGDIRALPSLQLRVRFSQRVLSERAGAIGLGIVFPAVLLGAAAWLSLTSAARWDSLALTAAIFGIGFPVAFGHRFFVRETVTLSPSSIEVHRGLYRATAQPKDVSRIMTVHLRKKYAHGVEAKGGQSVFFGPGLAPADFEKAREWLRALARARGIQYQENVDYADLARLLGAERRGSK